MNDLSSTVIIMTTNDAVYGNITEREINSRRIMFINTDKLRSAVFYIKDSVVFTIVLALPVTMIGLPLLFLLMPVLSKYETEPPKTTTTLPTSRVPQWGLKNCDTLKFCMYRLES